MLKILRGGDEDNEVWRQRFTKLVLVVIDNRNLNF